MPNACRKEQLDIVQYVHRSILDALTSLFLLCMLDTPLAASSPTQMSTVLLYTIWVATIARFATR